MDKVRVARELVRLAKALVGYGRKDYYIEVKIYEPLTNQESLILRMVRKYARDAVVSDIDDRGSRATIEISSDDQSGLSDAVSFLSREGEYGVSNVYTS